MGIYIQTMHLSGIFLDLYVVWGIGYTTGTKPGNVVGEDSASSTRRKYRRRALPLDVANVELICNEVVARAR
jgi:hypothetical protein